MAYNPVYATRKLSKTGFRDPFSWFFMAIAHVIVVYVMGDVLLGGDHQGAVAWAFQLGGPAIGYLVVKSINVFWADEPNAPMDVKLAYLASMMIEKGRGVPFFIGIYRFRSYSEMKRVRPPAQSERYIP